MEKLSAFELLTQRAQSKGIRYDLSVLRSSLEALHNPHLNLGRMVHIAGTNGKGSTLTFLAAALQHAGFSVGTFTSPHFLCYTERICINQIQISKEELNQYILLLSTLDIFNFLTEFELLTLISFLYFSERNPDFILYEVGLGGRLDATNLIQPELCIITRIGLDHTGILGNTLTQIAAEKAGIIKPGVPVITLLSQDPGAFEVIKAQAESLKAPIIPVHPLSTIPDGFKMNAAYQKENLALAIEAIRHLNGVSFAHAYQGLKEAQIWGRMMRLTHQRGDLLVDAAHNPDGVDALLRELQGQSHCLFIVGIYGPKDAQTMLEKMSLFCKDSDSKIAICDFWQGHSWTLDQARSVCPGFEFETYSRDLIPSLPDHNGPIILTGSIYFISLFKSYLEA